MSSYPFRMGRRVLSEADFEALWEALDDIPEGDIGEIVAGEVVVMPRPGQLHTAVASHLGVLLGAPFGFGIGGPGGWVILDEPRIRFGDEVRVPDLGGWRRERFVRSSSTGPFTIVPDWLCEVLSDSTVRQDRLAKLPLYAQSGVDWAWLLDPVRKHLEVYRRDGTVWGPAAVHRGP